MGTTNLSNEVTTVDTGMDSVVIVNHIEGIPGGRSLDITGFTPEVIQAGHIVIADSAGNHKPMPVAEDGKAYAALPASHSIVGVVVGSVLTRKAMVGIMVRGSVNEIASPYPVTAAMKTALPLIRFTQD
ncbi:MAG: hypothetical protein ACRCZB_04225 [Bacteroidales bacterium]